VIGGYEERRWLGEWRVVRENCRIHVTVGTNERQVADSLVNVPRGPACGRVGIKETILVLDECLPVGDGRFKGLGSHCACRLRSFTASIAKMCEAVLRLIEQL
jgi:hypothetical protein